MAYYRIIYSRLPAPLGCPSARRDLGTLFITHRIELTLAPAFAPCPSAVHLFAVGDSHDFDHELAILNGEENPPVARAIAVHVHTDLTASHLLHAVTTRVCFKLIDRGADAALIVFVFDFSEGASSRRI